jgi:type II secretion system protein G
MSCWSCPVILDEACKNFPDFLNQVIRNWLQLGTLPGEVQNTPHPKGEPLMKSEFQVKLLQHMARKKKDNEGFTLIELLVVIIIIGILAAIALPSFLNQANKAKQSEAKTYVGSMNRGQQAYFLENSTFATSVEGMGIGVKTETSNYQYTTSRDNVGATDEYALNKGSSQKAALKPYIGRVQLGRITDTSEATTLAVLCESKTAAKGDADTPDATPACTGDTTDVSK